MLKQTDATSGWLVLRSFQKMNGRGHPAGAWIWFLVNYVVSYTQSWRRLQMQGMTEINLKGKLCCIWKNDISDTSCALKNCQPSSLVDICKAKLLCLNSLTDNFLSCVVGLPSTCHLNRFYDSRPRMFPTEYQNLASLPNLNNVILTLDRIDFRQIRRDILYDSYGSYCNIVDYL